MDGNIGDIRLFAANFAPRGWAICNGQLLTIYQNIPLYTIIDTYFGGDGRSNFALPDLRGRAAVGWGSGSGLSPYTLGQKTGSLTNTLTVNQLPSHNHTISGALTMPATNQAANFESPAGNYFANDGSAKFDSQNDGGAMQSINITLSNAGAGTSINNMMPYLALNYIICLIGTYPSRH